MGSNFRWDDPVFNDGDYVKFNNKGDEVAGTIEEITSYTFPDKEDEDGKVIKGNTVPVLKLRVGTEQILTVTAGNAHLKEKLISLKPQVGDSIHITYVDDSPTKFGGKKKMFLVKVSKPVPAVVVDEPGQEIPF